MTESEGRFELTESIDAEIRRAAEVIVGAEHVLSLTGAGISVESGIPPFRGPGGLWTKHGEPPLDGYQRFMADPKAAWEERLNPTESWSKGLRDTLASGAPNAAHLALAEMERRGFLHALITQNIDDLHRQAGSRALLEIHGNASLLRCLDCVARYQLHEIHIDPAQLPPKCPKCGGIVKGDTVQFGEPIPADVLRECYAATERSDCVLVVGTSATVYPAAQFPLEVARRGGSVIEVNLYESELTPLTTISLRGPGGAVMDRLLHWCIAAAGQEEVLQ
jgi:NAD-dependent deacetylase